MKRFIFSLLLCLILTGCGNDYKDYEKPNMTVFGDTSTCGWYYAVDNTTNIVYIIHIGTHAFGVTVAYNADGTIMTKDDIKGNVTEEFEITTEEFERETDDVEESTDSMSLEEYNEYICSILPEDCLHPITIDNIENRGLYNGVNGIEGYSNWCTEYTVNAARQCGYDKETYPYWVRDDGCKMLGDYIICAADYKVYPYGTIIDTSLGKGIVIETGGTVCKYDKNYYKDIDIATTWY